MRLSPDDQRKLQDKELANIIRKLNAGKTLSAREEAKLAAASVADEPQTSGNAAPASGYVSTWEALAAACGVDRRTLTNVRDRHAPEIKKLGKELTRADGRHVIAAWIHLLDEKGVRGRGLNNPDSTPEEYIDERQFRLRRERLQLLKSIDALNKCRQ